MRKPLLLLLVILLLAIGYIAFWVISTIRAPVGKLDIASKSMATAEELETEQYKVYSTVLEQSYLPRSTKLLVIENETSADWLFENHPTCDYNLLKLAEGLLSFVSLETVKDFRARIGNPPEHSPLKSQFTLSIKYKLVTTKDLRKYFRESGNGWDAFYRDYPSSSGIIILSTIGFNETLSEALIYVQHSCGSLCASGQYICLRKEEGEWKVKQEHQLWVS